MSDVSRIPPWKPHERQKAFLDAFQVRWNLTQDQRASLDSQAQQEALMVAGRHLPDMLPVALEIVQTRAKNEPFTPEQVQRWSKAFKPLMSDSLQSVQRVTDRLKATMTPEQRALLENDINALMKRHKDFEKMVDRWEQGHWNPLDWGLQDDPIHAQAVAAYLAQEAERNRLVAQAEAKQTLDDPVNRADESAWDEYVRLFCERFECTDRQRTKAHAILKSSKSEAYRYRNARRDRIERCEQLIEETESDKVREAREAELARLLMPIEYVFDRLKSRLHSEILTTQQRKMFMPPEPKKPAPEPEPEPQQAPETPPPVATTQPVQIVPPPATQPVSVSPATTQPTG
jgi:hypothetical protein